MPDFPDSVEHSDHNQETNTDDDESRAFDRKISVSDAEKLKLSIFEGKESKSCDTLNGDKPRPEKTALMRENSVDTLASKLSPATR